MLRVRRGVDGYPRRAMQISTNPMRTCYTKTPRHRALAPRHDLREGIGPGQISGREVT